MKILLESSFAKEKKSTTYSFNRPVKMRAVWSGPEQSIQWHYCHVERRKVALRTHAAEGCSEITPRTQHSAFPAVSVRRAPRTSNPLSEKAVTLYSPSDVCSLPLPSRPSGSQPIPPRRLGPHRGSHLAARTRSAAEMWGCQDPTGHGESFCIGGTGGE